MFARSANPLLSGLRRNALTHLGITIRRMRPLSVAPALLLLLCTSGYGQTNPCSETPVQIPISVTDQTGRPVPNLGIWLRPRQ
jgi:hypothetical protein